jgi:two-component system sensor histidine kinase EvgS
MEEGSRYITFKVQDTGIGIEADKIEIIFEPFMQADNSYTRNYDGAGLGLSLVKKYVDLMKGVINVKSEVGVGSSFSICVPVFD